MAGVLLGAAGLLMLNFFTSAIIHIISMIVLSFSEILAMPFMMTVAVSKADSTNRGVLTGAYSTAWSIAFVLAPIIGTSIVTHYGFNTLWWVMAAFAMVTMIGLSLVVPHVYKTKDLSLLQPVSERAAIME
jgi:MFS family permease